MRNSWLQNRVIIVSILWHSQLCNMFFVLIQNDVGLISTMMPKIYFDCYLQTFPLVWFFPTALSLLLYFFHFCYYYCVWGKRNCLNSSILTAVLCEHLYVLLLDIILCPFCFDYLVNNWFTLNVRWQRWGPQQLRYQNLLCRYVVNG